MSRRPPSSTLFPYPTLFRPRFAARYAFAIDPGTADAIRRHARDLEGVSRERIGEEFRRMLAHPSRAQAVGLLGALGLDLVLLGQPGPGPRAGSLAALPDPTFPACLACLAFDRGLIQSGSQIPWLVRAWRGALCLSNEETDRLRAVLGGVVEAESLWQQLPPAQRKRRAAASWFPECRAVLTARDPSRAGSIAADVGALAADGVGLAPEPMIDGNDLLVLGVQAGPGFDRVLTAVYDAQLEGRVCDKARALDRFWRARSDRSGTGLGLNIVESVVRGHGGTLELIDTPDGGLTVRVTMALDR